MNAHTSAIYRVSVSEISAVVPPLLEPVLLALRMLQQTPMQFLPHTLPKLVRFGTRRIQLLATARKWLKALDQSYKRLFKRWNG